MQYRPLGSTGFSVSVLGFGCLRMPTKTGRYTSPDILERESVSMIQRAVDAGINYFDTAYSYHEGQSEVILGRGLAGGLRHQVYIATKSPVWLIWEKGDFSRILEEQLTRLQTDYIDLYLFHGLTKHFWENKVLRLNLIQELEALQKAGKVRRIGFSFHDQLPVFQAIVDGYDRWDVCQIQFNYVDTQIQAGLAGLEYAARKGLGLVVMEPLRGGRLAVPTAQMLAAMWPEQSPVEWALDYVWNRPEVGLLLSGMRTMEELEQNIAYAQRAAPSMLTEAELAMLERVREIYVNMAQVPCTGCEYCMPCPFALDIPKIFETYNYAFSEVLAFALKDYALLSPQADACQECGKCEARCPQGIPVSQRMKDVAKLFARY